MNLRLIEITHALQNKYVKPGAVIFYNDQGWSHALVLQVHFEHIIISKYDYREQNFELEAEALTLDRYIIVDIDENSLIQYKPSQLNLDLLKS